MKIPKKLLESMQVLIDDIKNDKIDLKDLWFKEMPFNPITDTQYNGYNMIQLNYMMNKHSYKRNIWMTFKQIKDNNGTLIKGSKSVPVIFWKMIKKEEENEENGSKEEKVYPIVRYYNVFNLDQTEGLDFYDVKNDINTYKDVDEFVNTFNPNIVYGGNESFYIPKEDEIHLPEISNFNSIDDYYHTLFHELSHWTGNPKRLNRPLQSLEKDRKKYAKEELIAELSSYFISTTFGFNVKPKAAGYLKSWLSALDWKPESLIEVSSKAYKVYDYIINRNFV